MSRTLSGTLVLLLMAGPALAAGPVTRHSGTVIGVDRAAGTLVVGEVGPWQVKAGETVITRRTIAVTRATEFSRVARAAGPGPGGWVGEYVERATAAWSVKEGDFVTVTVERSDARLTAVRVCVPEPGE
jgi:hypothetical protein